MSAMVKSGVVTTAFYPVKSKKVCYVCLKDRVLEVYKSSKDERNGKDPKYLFDLSTVLNVHLHNDPSMKDCISVMLPDETFFIRVDSQTELKEWFENILEMSRQARSAALGRPVFREEYFEVAWDVELVKLPKLRKKSKVEEKMDDLVARYEYLIGKKRLCMYPHSLLIVRTGVTASENAVPPLRSDEYMEFAMNTVSNFGQQEKYFFLRVGRISPTGSGELWLSADSGENASLIYERVNTICERESEKRRMQGNEISLVSPRTLLNHAHRERSYTQNHRTLASDSLSLRSYKEATRKPSSASVFCSPTPKISSASIQHALKARCASFGHTSFLTTAKCSGGLAKDNMDIQKRCIHSVSSSVSKRFACSPEVTNTSVSFLENKESGEEQESSGGTIMYVGGEDEMNQVASECKYHDKSSVMDDYNGEYISAEVSPAVTESGCTAKRSALYKQNSQTSFGDKSADVMGSNLHGYTPMECSPNMNSLSIGDFNFNLTEVRSYVSDSTDSCHSGAFSSRRTPSTDRFDSQRAYSLGSRPLSQTCIPLSSARNGSSNISNNVIDESVTKQFDDPRKRAHSLGSKSWLKPLRKNSVIRSSAVTEAADAGCIRNRSDSFGSSVSAGVRTVYTGSQREGRKTTRSSAPDHDLNDDLTEWDYRVNGRSGSSSIASVDSPSHSRTSSFGVNAGDSILRSAVEEIRQKKIRENSAAAVAEKLASVSERFISDCRTEDIAAEVHAPMAEEDESDYVYPSAFISKGNDAYVGKTDRSPNKTNAHRPRLIATIPERNASSGSSRSVSPVSVCMENGSSPDSSVSLTLGTDKNALKLNEEKPDLLLPKCSVLTGEGNDQPQLDYAVLAVPSDTVKTAPCIVNIVQSGVLQVVAPKVSCDYSVVESQNSTNPQSRVESN